MNPDRILTLDTLGDLDDGTVKRLIEKAMQEALTDCDNRPALGKARRVTIQLSLEPEQDDRGAMKGVHMDVQVKTALPARSGRTEYLKTSIIGNDVKAFLPDSYEQNLFEPEGVN